MKAKIHPKYHPDLKIACACGNVIIAGSTKENVHTEICSACHPFYTGHQKLLDTAGRVDKFMAKVKKAQQLKEKKVKKIDQELDEIFEEPVKEKAKQTQILNMEEAKELPAEEAEAPKAKAKATKAKAEKAPAKKTATKKK